MNTYPCATTPSCGREHPDPTDSRWLKASSEARWEAHQQDHANAYLALLKRMDREAIAKFEYEYRFPVRDGWSPWEKALPSQHEMYLTKADALLAYLLPK